MRIALVSREYPPETGWGGIGTHTYHLAHALAATGHEVHVVSRSDRAHEYDRRDGDVVLHRIRERKGRGALTELVSAYVPLSDWRYSQRVAEKVWELHRREPFHVVEAPEYRAEAYHLVQRPPAPMVIKLHTPTCLLEEWNGLPRRLREDLVKRMERRAALSAASLSAPSRSMTALVAKAWGLPTDSVRVVPNPIDVESVPAQPWPEGDPTILFVGRFERRKGLDVLAEAVPLVLQQVPAARFVLAGGPAPGVPQGPFAERIVARLREQGTTDRVRILPWQNAGAVLEQYRRCHVVVVPSLFENYPGVCLEAMASARPVVASAVGGLAEILDDGMTGRLVPPRDAPALARALVDLAQDVEACRRMGARAREWVVTHSSAQTVAARTLEWYQDARDRVARTSPLRVAYVMANRWIDLARPDGATVHLLSLWKELEACGLVVVRATLAAFRPRPTPGPSGREALASRGQATTIKEERLDSLRASRSLRGSIGDLWRKISDVACAGLDALGILAQVWRARPVDIVHERYSLYSLGGWLAARVLRRPFVFEFETPLIEEVEQLHRAPLGRLRLAWARRVLRLNLRSADVIRVPSRVLLDHLVERWQVEPSRVAVLPNGFDPSRFSPLTSGHPEEPIVIFVGSLQPWHGCDLLVSAFAGVKRRIPEARLVIVGDGVVRRAVEAQVATLGLDGCVTWTGALPHDEVPRWLAKAAVAAAPYPKLPVGFYFSPNKVFEYMGAGKAIVASRVGQLAEILEHRKSALLVEPGNTVELEGALVDALQDPALRRRLGDNAHARAGEFTWRRQAEGLSEIYARLAGRRSMAHEGRPACHA